MRCKTAICCSKIVLDKLNNNFSAINIIEQLNAYEFPFISPPLSALFFLTKETDENRNQTVTVCFALNDETIAENEFEIEFGENSNNSRLYMTVGGLKLRKTGFLTVSVKSGESVLGSWEIDIRKEENEDDN